MSSEKTEGNIWKLKHSSASEGDQALALVAQRGYGVAILERIQKLSGHGLDAPAYAERLDLMAIRGPI